MKTSHLILVVLLILISSSGLVACNLNLTASTTEQDLIATSVNQTTVALSLQSDPADTPAEDISIPNSNPSETPTVEIMPTNTPLPSLSPEPTATTPVEDNRILFAPGTTFATVRGEVQENTQKDYILQISDGQMLSISVEAESNTPVLAVSGADGKEILSASSGFSWYLTTVQKTQDYTISIIPGDSPASYILHVATPIDVDFDSGTTSKTFQGMITPDDIVEFRAYALKGQKAKVNLTAISGQASLHVYGLSDLVNYVEVDSGATRWEATLQEDQNYIIKVLANDQPTEFSLLIEFLNQ